MNAETRRVDAGKIYLLVPMMPTPNGPLHLGHISGPYLKMDVLCRSLRQRGHHASLITTTDAFESHILQSAEQYGVSPVDGCARFHEEIRRDFAYMGIRFDVFINPVSPEYAEDFRRTHAEVVEGLVARGQAIYVQERYLFNEATGEDMLGYRLSGECPACGTATVGFVCENCGLQVTTELLRGLDGEKDSRHLSWKQGDTLALKVSDRDQLRNGIAAMSLQPEFKQAMTTFIDSPENIIRLTVLGGHGVGPFHSGGRDYTLYNTYFGHAIFCGRIHAQLRGEQLNSFAQTCNVVTVTSCGLDNATDLTASMAYEAAHSGYKAFDHCLGNFFLNLEGEKFSTSRRHAIFVSDMIASPKIRVDALRLYLAQISPQRGITNFDIQEFIDYYNDWFIARLSAAIQRAWAAITGAPSGAVPESALNRLHSILSTRDQALNLDQFNLTDCAAALRDFCDTADPAFVGSDEAYWWLKTFAVAVWPLMPRLSIEIWQALGHQGEPTIAGFVHPTKPVVEAELLMVVEAIDRRDFHCSTQ